MGWVAHQHPGWPAQPLVPRGPRVAGAACEGLAVLAPRAIPPEQAAVAVGGRWKGGGSPQGFAQHAVLEVCFPKLI